MVDIIQAVGRVIRKATGKQLGTIVIPVFIDESKDADHVLSQSAFEPVWQVLKALRAHDRRTRFHSSVVKAACVFDSERIAYSEAVRRFTEGPLENDDGKQRIK